MQSIKAVINDILSYFNVRTTSGKKRILVVLFIVIAGFVGGTQFKSEGTTPQEAVLKTVSVATVTSLSETSSFNLIGSVEAVSQAKIQSEASGRVVEVLVELGDIVSAGQVIARLENASEYASLLQAEGVYEASLAAASQSNISVDQAENDLFAAQNSAQTTYRNAYTAVYDTFRGTLDDFYGNPEAKVPGVRIDTKSYTSSLNAERVAFQDILTGWQKNTGNATVSLDALLVEAKSNTQRTIDLVDTFSNVITAASNNETLQGAPLKSYLPRLTAERATLTSILNSLTNAETSLINARESLKRAQLGGTAIENSTANAQVKQALGSLKAAQANYAKTIIRTPITGVLNELSLKKGDFVSQFTNVALVANNNALEITAYVGEKDSDRITVGQRVELENGTEGTIIAIAPAIDSVTKKIEVKIATESDEITNGDTVTILIHDAKTTTETSDPLLIPITAIKFSDTAGTIFTVDDATLVAHSVTLGSVRGSFVEITEGVTSDMRIVIDARGLTEGQEVEAVSKN